MLGTGYERRRRGVRQHDHDGRALQHARRGRYGLVGLGVVIGVVIGVVRIVIVIGIIIGSLSSGVIISVARVYGCGCGWREAAGLAKRRAERP